MIDEPEEAAVTIGEEIECLLAAGWTWDGNRLVHPQHKDVWTQYRRTFSHPSRVEHFDAEVEQAVREARKRRVIGEADEGGHLEPEARP